MWAALAPIVLPIIKLLLGLFVEKINEPDVAVDADRNPTLRARLEHRVRESQDRAHPGG